MYEAAALRLLQPMAQIKEGRFYNKRTVVDV
jgi:hypothetical protein